MVKMTPSPDVDDDDGRYARSCRFSRQRWTTSNGRMDESGQGPRKAVAKTAARPVGIQPSIKNHSMFLLQIGQLLGYFSYKSYVFHSVLRRVPAVGRRQCRSPRGMVEGC
jgi:hypothetical protein